MKATTIILAAVFILSTSILLAGNDRFSTAVITENSTIMLASVSPVTPSEATFEDMPSDMVSIADLTPLTPVAADFNDAMDSISIDNDILAPVTPAVADFE